MLGDSGFTDARERIDEGVFFAEFEERKIGLGVAVSGEAAGDVVLGEADDLFLTFVVFADHVGEEFDFLAPIKSRAETQVKSQSLADTGDPELRAGGGEDEDVSFLFVLGDFLENFRIGEFREPVCEESLHVSIELFPAHSPEIAMKDTLHSAGTEDFVQREEGEENKGEETSGRFLPEDIAPKNELGIPRNDRLVEIEEDVFKGHCENAKRLRVNWNFNFGQSEGRFFSVKAAIFALGVMATPLHAQLYADVKTTMGDFTLELFYEDSPMTVANFVSLAEGSRNWIDPVTGIVQVNKPYFNGIIFHRVIDGFMNQVGSPQGTGSDGPGYVFPDEVDNGLLHDEAYILSSANSGPNTNGSQLFITVDVTDWLDGIHTVFGKVSSGTEIIDAINKVEVGTFFNGRFDSTRPIEEVSINTVTIRREGVEANAFDVTAQGLPEVEPLAAEIQVSGDAMELLLNQPPRTTLEVFRSVDLLNWEKVIRHSDSSQDALTGFDISGGPLKAYFRPALVRWPVEATFPSDLDQWVFTASADNREFEFQFGDSPSLSLQENGGDVETYTIFDQSYSSDGYGGFVAVVYEVPVEGGINYFLLESSMRPALPFGASPSGITSASFYRWTGSWSRISSVEGTFSMVPLP